MGRPPGDEFVFRHLNYWLAAFSDRNKYKIYLYNENMKLPEWFGGVEMVNRAKLMQDPECQRLHQLISTSNITPRWRAAAFALGAPYFYLKDNNVIYQIDADDIIIYGQVQDKLEKAKNIILENNIPTLSYDMNFSHHFVFGFERKHHFSMGVNIAQREQMKDLILANVGMKNMRMSFGQNLDLCLDFGLERTGHKYICFTTEHKLYHCDTYWCHYNKDKNTLENSLNGQVRNNPVHPRTVII